MVFGFYVIFHGHYSPGGGFQGGALLAASLLLIRISSGRRISRIQFSDYMTTPLAVLGVVIYFGTGLLAIAFGGNFLDYSYLPLPGIEGVMLRYWGILIIEFGIGMAVMAVLVSIFDDILKGEDFEEEEQEEKEELHDQAEANTQE